MPEFEVATSASAVLTVWADPPSGSKPSRINPIPAYPHKYRRVQLGASVTVFAAIGGVVGLLDGALAGRLFTTIIAEYPPGSALPPVSSPPGQSSIASFTPLAVGHYLVVMRRPAGGAVCLPLFVET